jgi:hypothetical protein
MRTCTRVKVRHVRHSDVDIGATCVCSLELAVAQPEHDERQQLRDMLLNTTKMQM